MSKIPTQHFSTTHLSGDRNFQEWQELCGLIERPELIDNDDLSNFYAELQGYMLGNVGFCRSSSINQRFTRTNHMIASSHLEHIYISLYLVGDCLLTSKGMNITVKAGDILLLDLEQSYQATVTSKSGAYENIVCMFSKQALIPYLPNLDLLHQTLLPANCPMNQLLTQFILTIDKNIKLYSVDQAEGISRSLIVLIANSFAEIHRSLSIENKYITSNLMSRITTVIAENISEIDLSSDFITRSLHISNATLIKACQSYGGVKTLIRRKKLQQAYKLLLNDPHLSIGEIAYGLYFNNLDTFSRAFRREFGMLPSEVRRTKSLLTPEQPRSSVTTTIHSWVKEYIF